MTETMRATVPTGPRAVHVETVLAPAPGRYEARVKLAGCGVCASNLAPWEGPQRMRFPLPPGGPGHEGRGAIDAVGEGVVTP